MNLKSKLVLLAEEEIKEKTSSLKKFYEITYFYDPMVAVEKIFAAPPDILLVQESLAKDLIKGLILALKNDLRLTCMPVVLIVERINLPKSWEDCPVDDFVFSDSSLDEYLSRINLALARVKRLADNNPLTGLPGNTSILKTIQEKLNTKEDVAVAYVDIDQFKPFNDRYGFARGDEILRMVGRVLLNVISDKCREKGFVGHIGGDDFVFICPNEQIEETCKEIIKEYESILPSFLDPEDLKKGYFVAKDRQGIERKIPFPSISIAVVPLKKGKFKHYGEVSAAASQVKKMAKAIEGNSYFIDRRQH
ncbi:GGDEF domain-containing protein [Thermodesulfatator atlanticus]|uniref:GGDEF domain-containing protein n=1 Tax=Thermodesulfatator atlanticus TaxID=501497 RepID=UPI0003B65044|nr:diguanylate cyclase [Thermodesulfatator atlanticus]